MVCSLNRGFARLVVSFFTFIESGERRKVSSRRCRAYRSSWSPRNRDQRDLYSYILDGRNESGVSNKLERREIVKDDAEVPATRRKEKKAGKRIVDPGSRVTGIQAAKRREATVYKQAVFGEAGACEQASKEGVCIGLVPRRLRLKLITSSSDVTGLWPMPANSLAASIARYRFTGFYPGFTLAYRSRLFPTISLATIPFFPPDEPTKRARFPRLNAAVSPPFRTEYFPFTTRNHSVSEARGTSQLSCTP